MGIYDTISRKISPAEEGREERCKGGDAVKTKVVGLCILALGVAMIAIGISQGQQMGVFGKAIRICLECIGIG